MEMSSLFLWLCLSEGLGSNDFRKALRIVADRVRRKKHQSPSFE